ncbi:MAG: helix-turn-helix transcriptional regulator [Planctomycetaceae bacterium]|nr:helix-turn-helix transcriptional regulator [Planctomycetaceae bacterium]
MATTLFPHPSSKNKNKNENIIKKQKLDGQPVSTEPTPTPDADTSVSGQITKELVRWFKLLADETRLKILIYLLERRELNVRALCDLLQLSQPAVSHHLALLRGDGLIDCRRDGKHNFYRVLPERLSELMGIVFSRQPGREPQLRFGQCVLIFQRDKDVSE